MALLPTFFFRQFRPWKYLLRYSRTKEKKPFYAVKSKRSESRKIDIFPKGLTHGFSPKMIIFPSFFLKQFRPGKCLLRYSRAKKRLLRHKNNKFKNLKNWHFSQRVNPWFWSENGHFSNLFFFLRNLGQENFFYKILERKNAFLRYKNKKFKHSKNWHFSQEVIPWFGFKNGHFSNFFHLGNLDQENIFYDILEQKKKNLCRL